MEKKEPSPISVVWGWAEKYHSKFYGSVVLAVLGVAGTMLAYFSIAAMIRILLENGDFSQCMVRISPDRLIRGIAGGS